ncbi:uncharacterized protein KRP23_13363 [Phytophthora ramorum]|uniref:uncharacterized protein n=1 Tax=Phytophthora ramorum TaxID=164328 RepID=UPI0030AFECE7|nr:hypothetical protein KRP23_13363 [Phytophthora ramorum]
MDQNMSRPLATVTNLALVLELKAAVARVHEIDVELDDLALALKDDHEEVETYTDDIADCCDRIEAIDEFVCELEVGNVPAVVDTASALMNMGEERDEEENMLKVLRGARTCHEQQLQQLTTRFTALQQERQALHKKSSQICCIFGRNGVFELVRQRLAERNTKLL